MYTKRITHTHTHAQIHTTTHEKCKWCICNCVTSERRTEKCENVTVKVTIPPKLSLLCVSIYAVKAERKKHLGKDQAGTGKEGRGGGVVQVRAEAYNKDHRCKMNYIILYYKAARLQHTPPLQRSPSPL